MDTYVLVHGAWHTGHLLKQVADAIEAEGHKVYTPTLAYLDALNGHLVTSNLFHYPVQ